ncbi:MAG: hypothetical protein JNM50_03925 [Chromatiales bacterium]|nr:hypothetical protein [Chromatiales bacterium]
MSKKPSRTQTSGDQRPADPERDQRLAQQALRPSLQAALTTREFLPFGDEVPTMAFVQELVTQVDAVTGGNLARGEAMLVAQAHTLDAIFNRLALSASKVSMTNQYEMFMKLALRAQNQARMTWETLAAIKNPPQVSIVRQTNIAAGPQQVNNGPPCPPSQIGKRPNELLEVTHGERLDPGAAGAAGSSDTRLEAVGAVDGTEDARG